MFDKVTRLEVIDEIGRQYVRHNCSIEASLQDGGRTLKIFVTDEVKKMNKGMTEEKGWSEIVHEFIQEKLAKGEKIVIQEDNKFYAIDKDGNKELLREIK